MKTVMVVDDNIINLKLVRDILEFQGYEVIAEDNPKNVVNILQNNTPDLILLDIQMPELDGASLLKIIRDDLRIKDVPIIALTAYAMKGDRERFLRMGFDDYIEKPIEVKNFLRKMEEYLVSKKESKDTNSR